MLGVPEVYDPVRRSPGIREERPDTCSFCRRAVSVSLDDTVEVVFTVAASVRQLKERPMNEVAQALID